MNINEFILYTIGVNRTIERDQLHDACLTKFPAFPAASVSAIVADLIKAGHISAFGSTLSLAEKFEPCTFDEPSPEPEHTNSRPLVLMVGGALGLIMALCMDTSVPVPGSDLSVNNLGLMNTRIVLAIGGVGLLLGGILLKRKD